MLEPITDQKSPDPPIISQAKRDDGASHPESPHTLTDEDQKSENGAAASFILVSEIDALKKKILELEKQVKQGSATCGDFEGARKPLSDSGSVTTRPEVLTDMNGYERMEESPNEQRKEWDGSALQKESPRLRRTLECDMGSMFLAERLDARTQEKAREQTISQEQKYQTGRRAKNEDSRCGASAQLKLNRQDWFAFKRLPRSAESQQCVIDILIGEPDITDDNGRDPHVYLSDRIRKINKFQSSEAPAPGEGPLPERIRVRSAPLLRLLATADALGVYYPEPVCVFVRPFKSLFYCKDSLRSWCNKLEQEFEALCMTTGLGLTNEGESEQHFGLSEDQKLSKADDVSGSPTVAVQQTFLKGDKREVNSKDEAEDREAHGVIAIENTSGDEEDEQKVDLNDISRSTMALDHLKCLLSFMDSEILARQKYLNSPDCRKIFFSDLWYLFRPGMEVIGKDGKQAYRVIKVASPRHCMSPAWQAWPWALGDKTKAPFSVHCVYIDFDGKNLGPVSRVFHFSKFDGQMDATSLPIYPLRLHPVTSTDFSEAEWLNLESSPPYKRYRQKLINRGAKFLEALGMKAMYYAGPAPRIREGIQSQVVIDFETAFSMNNEQQGWKPDLEILLGNSGSTNATGNDDINDGDNVPCRAPCCWDEPVFNDTYVDGRQSVEYISRLLTSSSRTNQPPSIALLPRPLGELWSASGEKHHEISDDERVIMSYRVFGFILRSRQWAQLDLSYLVDPQPLYSSIMSSPNAKRHETIGENGTFGTAFDHLVLEEGQKPMIQALVAQYFRDKQSKTGHREQVDIVKGKGKGLILLLHGAPGVGKTSTAEGVAESFNKPLLQVTCGDLGTTAKEIEKALDFNFTLADRWDCLMLLDEADVFLGQRQKDDFQRNGIVAVLLRALEYYAGVLFLTTNRVGDFDEAFTSRIHVILYYPELDKHKTLKVFEIHINMIMQRYEERKRTIIIDDVADFASDYFDRHPLTRWNGRQIRNACQTALALAEFEAQSNSHETIRMPVAPVHLKVAHFETVQKAYLQFAEYMNSIYGASSSIRAKEGRVHAILIDEDKRIVSTSGLLGGVESRREVFRAASQGQQQAQPVQTEKQPQQQPLQAFQQQAPIQPQQAYHPQGFSTVSPGIPNLSVPPYHAYPNYGLSQPIYPQFPGQMQAQATQVPPPSQFRAGPDVSVGNPITGQGEGQNWSSTQPTTTPTLPPLQQTVSPGFDQNIQNVYAAGSPQGTEQRPSSNLPSAGGGFPQGTPQWQGH